MFLYITKNMNLNYNIIPCFVEKILKKHLKFVLYQNNVCGYCNPSFGFATKAKRSQGCRPRGSSGVKAKRWQRCGPRKSLGVISHTPGTVRKCEGIWGSEPSESQNNSHFGKWTPNGLPNFKEQFQGTKLNGLWRYLYHWKALGT
jgi:hypothetical protein